MLGDTHGNQDLMMSAAAAMRDRHGATVFIHLGDHYRDGLALRKQGYQVWCVPGLQCPAYGTSERILRENIGGIRVVAAHTPDDLARALGDADLALHGHTHIPLLERRGQAVWLNPGHLKSPLDRGHRPSFAVLKLEPGAIEAAIHGVDGDLVAMESFKVSMVQAHG